ncbi:AN1-type zinc finger protein 4 [Aplochiton taeniatus]
MADRKEPPFYNDDSLGAFHYKLPFYDTMELFIETLTGTCFELRVFPFETVISVKAKIQRLEGIPIAQQHLIWNNLELDDEYSLHDYNIAEGCTLKLVLAMRGGPINTRRVAMEEPMKDMANLMESSSTREEGSWEKTLPSKQVTFLVYREGDQLNFFRVVDCKDGTPTPLSGSLSGCSLVYNMFAEEVDGDGSATAAGIPTLENSITMNKMKLLKAKMEDLNLNKKPKKFKKRKPQPPIDPHPVGRSLALPSMRQHYHRLFNVLPPPNHSLQPKVQLAPIRGNKSTTPSPPSAATKSITRQAPSIFNPSSCFMLQEEELWESGPSLAQIRPPPKVSSLRGGSSKLMRDCVYPQLPPFSSKGKPEEAAKPHRLSLGLGSLDEAARLMDHPQPGALFGNLKDPSEPLSLDVSVQPEGVSSGIGPLEVEGTESPLPFSTPPLLLQSVGASPFCPLGLADRTPFGDSSSCRPLPQPFEFTVSSLHPSPPVRTSALLKSSVTRTAQVQDIQEVSPGKCPEKTSKNEERGVTMIANQASKEPLGLLSNIELTSRAPRLSSREGGLGMGLAAASASGLGLLSSTAPSVPANIKLLREDIIKRMSPLHRTAASYLPNSSLGSPGGASTSIRRLSTPSYYLPPIKFAVGSGKKKNAKICFVCGKKTGLATSYECRCGNNFCATHRYAETHNCTYDYKSAGRRFLQKTNPIISAPKLPKI